MATDPTKLTVEMAEVWAGVAPPNETALAMAADLRQVIEAFESLRGRLGFEEEPSDFEAALLACQEDA